jgi:hypothetical protein
VLVVRLVLADVAESRPPPGVDGTLVPEVRIDRDARPAPLVPQAAGDGARRVRAETASARGWNQEHVDPAGGTLLPHLQVADRLVVRLDDERLDLRAASPLEHLGAREPLVVPVARDLRIVVPRGQKLRVGVRRRP